MSIRFRSSSKLRTVVLLVVLVTGFVLALPRLRAEFYYIGVVWTEGDIDWFYKLAILGKPAFPVFMRLLGNDDAFIRDQAARFLGMMGDPRAVPRLMKVARDDADPEARRTAVKALGMIGDSRAVPVLKELSWRNTLAIDALGNCGEEGKRALIEHYRTHPDPVWRARGLGRLCRPPFETDEEVKAESKSAVIDPAPEVRVAGLGCVRELLGESAKEWINPRLEDPDLRVRLHAGWELGKLGDESGFEVVKEILLDRSLPDELRADAARALGETGHPDAESILVGVREQESSAVLKLGITVGMQNLGRKQSR